MTEAYLREFEIVARRVFSAWNRDPGASATGSLDRQYWGWKYKDFSDSTLQYGVRLAISYAESKNHTAVLPEILKAYVRYCQEIQHRDGSFDQCYPYERSPGVFYDFMSTLIDLRESPYLADDRVRNDLELIIERGARFVLKTDERHGEVANHIAQYAFELYRYAVFSGDDAAWRSADRYLERLLSLFNEQEGWFLEYEGADAGYQTRTLRYLVKIAALLEREDLWQIAARGARFVEHLMMPDGSIHPMLGCRSTALVYPFAFESLAGRYPEFRSLADLVYKGWNDATVPLPSTLDFGNAIRLADDAREAAAAAEHAPTLAAGNAESQPLADMDLPDAGIAIRRRANRTVYVGYSLGGVVVAYKREKNGVWRLAYEDSGYLVETGRKRWVSRRPGSGKLSSVTSESLSVRATFHESLHEDVSPGQLVFLRLLNLTFLRFQWIGDLFRKLVVGRLIAGRRPTPGELIRTIELTPGALVVTDQVNVVSSRTLRLFRCRRLTGTHMASSRYFQPHELLEVAAGWKELRANVLERPTRQIIEL